MVVSLIDYEEDSKVIDVKRKDLDKILKKLENLQRLCQCCDYSDKKTHRCLLLSSGYHCKLSVWRGDVYEGEQEGLL